MKIQVIIENYQQRQQLYRKLYGKKYNYYHTEYAMNEYGKAAERRIVINDIRKNIKKNQSYIYQRKWFICRAGLTMYPFKIILNELGIEKCIFYDLRESYATKTLTNGIEIRDVVDILGHRNVETTEIYYISSTENLDD